MNRKEQIKQMIRDVVKKHLPNQDYKLFIFGSQANLPDLIRSDIDVGIDAGTKLEYGLMSRIHQDLEDMPTLYFFDFVDFKNVSDKFNQIALKNIETL
ncbi:MAG: hypothetical protein SFY32_03165 [Bacteroidota bacterium]|nr:hypothetical protein [Bacteroidota bacterium]